MSQQGEATQNTASEADLHPQITASDADSSSSSEILHDIQHLSLSSSSQRPEDSLAKDSFRLDTLVDLLGTEQDDESVGVHEDAPSYPVPVYGELTETLTRHPTGSDPFRTPDRREVSIYPTLHTHTNKTLD